MDMHKGHIYVTSDGEETGSTFSLLLPVVSKEVSRPIPPILARNESVKYDNRIPVVTDSSDVELAVKLQVGNMTTLVADQNYKGNVFLLNSVYNYTSREEEKEEKQEQEEEEGEEEGTNSVNINTTDINSLTLQTFTVDNLSGGNKGLGALFQEEGNQVKTVLRNSYSGINKAMN